MTEFVAWLQAPRWEMSILAIAVTSLVVNVAWKGLRR